MVPPTHRINPAINNKGTKPEDLPSIATSAANSSGSLETGETSCAFASSLVFGSMMVGIADTSDADVLPAASARASRRWEARQGPSQAAQAFSHAGLWAAINNSSMDPTNEDAVSVITPQCEEQTCCTGALLRRFRSCQIGRASCRERV